MKHLIKAIVLICISGLLLAGCGDRRGASGGVATSVQKVGDRRFVLVEPRGLRGDAPLVLALHGGFGNADAFQKAVPMADLAAKEGYRVAYLEGTGTGPRGNIGRSWNAGTCCGPAQEQGIDDVAYIRAVISQMRAQGKVSEVMMFGHSNGAMMTYRFLCEGRTRVSKAVIVSGSKMADGCRLEAGADVLVIHGDDDPNVPPVGGLGKGPTHVPFTSLTQSVQRLETAGASVRIRRLAGIGHKVGDVDSGLRRDTGQSLSDTISNFMF